MSGLNKKCKRIVLSSDSEDSVHENQDMTSHQTLTKKKRPKLTSSSKRIRKYASSFIEDEAVESDRLQSSSETETTNNLPDNSESTSNDSTVQNNNEEQVGINNGHTTNSITTNNSLFYQHHDNETATSSGNLIFTEASNFSISPIQTSIDEYFPPSDNSFQEINSLVENDFNFRIRCKVLYISTIKSFGTNGKVFDAIVCDLNSEIKIVAFNEEVERLYHMMIVKQSIIIENGEVQKANPRFRSPFSMLEIRLLPNSIIQTYNKTSSAHPLDSRTLF